MPISKYFKGSGEKVMRNMKDQYGEEKGEDVFYATAEKKGQKPGQKPGRSIKVKAAMKQILHKGGRR